MASATGGDPEQEIRFATFEDWRVTTDVETGVTTPGETRERALESLDEAVPLHRGEIGRPLTDEELGDVGIDPGEYGTGEREPPDVLD